MIGRREVPQKGRRVQVFDVLLQCLSNENIAVLQLLEDRVGIEVVPHHVLFRGVEHALAVGQYFQERDCRGLLIGLIHKVCFEGDLLVRAGRKRVA